MTEDERRARMERALLWSGPTHRLSDIAALIRDGKCQWWGQGDGMIVTEMIQYPLVKTINYFLIAGALRECLALEAEINAFAIENGCEIATAVGRRGWGKVAQPTGWRQHSYTFWKPLGDRLFWERGNAME